MALMSRLAGHTALRQQQPAKEAAHKVPRINAVKAGPHNDVEVTPFLEVLKMPSLMLWKIMIT